jgi:hypothetical protein
VFTFNLLFLNLAIENIIYLTILSNDYCLAKQVDTTGLVLVDKHAVAVAEATFLPGN